jgi:biopolymer transport protein ExbB
VKEAPLQVLQDLISRGGPVFWLLIALSVVGVTLVLERAWFWWSTNGTAGQARMQRMARCLRAGDEAGARALAESDGGIYGRAVLALLSEKVTDASAIAVIEEQRSTLERFMPVLSSMITGAPLLGLVGTVVGLISTFRFMSDKIMTVDPRGVGAGLSEALLNTVAGLAVALLVLFPYNAYRAQIDRTLGRLEMLVAAALQRQKKSEASTSPNEDKK